MNFSLSRRIILTVNSTRKFVALMLMLWMPLFFSGAAYAATQMELANANSHEVAQTSHACHHMNSEKMAAHQETKHSTGDSHCQHCSFCVSFVTPLNEISTYITHQPSPLAHNAMWASSTHNITPDHRPPIDA